VLKKVDLPVFGWPIKTIRGILFLICNDEAELATIMILEIEIDKKVKNSRFRNQN
jgi:hypothetical protein